MVDALPAPSLASPGGCYIGGDDNLRMTVLNAAAGVTVRVAGRFLHVEPNEPPRVEPFSYTLVPATDRTASTLTRRLGTGWLLQASASASAGSPLTGHTFVILSVVRGFGGGVEDLATLSAQYVTAQQRLGWPSAGIANSLEGCGALRSITGATPAAGAEVSETVPTGARWDLLAFRAKLTADANVATRGPALLLDDGTNIYAHATTNTGPTASAQNTIVWGQGPMTPFTAQVSYVLAGLPANLRLSAGHRIRTLTGSIQVGDQWSLVQYLVREWIEGA